MAPVTLDRLTVEGWFTTWHVDWFATGAVVVVAVAYVLLARRATSWAVSRTVLFLSGLAAVAVVRASFLAAYDHRLFWVLAVEDVLLLALLPLLLVLGRPVELVRGPRRSAFPPIVGSLLAVGTLLAVYLTGWDQARLEHHGLFRATQVLLLLAGCAFLGPLLGDNKASYGVRTLTAFVDGLLDALPGLAILGAHGLIARSWYDAHPRTWGMSPSSDQQVGGTAMIALSELVGLPTLIVLLVQWVRADAVEAAEVDLRLDTTGATVVENAEETRPWWETNAGPLAGRAAKEGWGSADQR